MFTLYEIINYSFVIIVIEFSFLLKNVIKRMGEEKERFLEKFSFLKYHAAVCDFISRET